MSGRLRTLGSAIGPSSGNAPTSAFENVHHDSKIIRKSANAPREIISTIAAFRRNHFRKGIICACLGLVVRESLGAWEAHGRSNPEGRDEKQNMGHVYENVFCQ